MPMTTNLLSVNANSGDFKVLDATKDYDVTVYLYGAAACNFRTPLGDNTDVAVAAQSGNDFIINGLNVHGPFVLNLARTWVRANSTSSTTLTWLSSS